MTKDEIEHAVKEYNRLIQAGNAVLCRYREIFEAVYGQRGAKAAKACYAVNDNCFHVTCTGIDNDDFDYTGSDVFDARRIFDLPLAYAWDDNWQTTVRADFEKRLVEAEAAKRKEIERQLKTYEWAAAELREKLKTTP